MVKRKRMRRSVNGLKLEVVKGAVEFEEGDEKIINKALEKMDVKHVVNVGRHLWIFHKPKRKRA